MDTCFYYWIQVISGWDISSMESRAYNYYRSVFDTASDSEKSAAKKIHDILSESADPRGVLAQLYTGDFKNKEALLITELSKPLRDDFDPVWKEGKPELGVWRKKLEGFDFSDFKVKMDTIVVFFDADFTIDRPVTIYLIQNPPFGAAVGHTISKSDFILVHPAGSERTNRESTTSNTIVHEYIHAVEFKSRVTRGLFKESYDEIIKPRDLPNPPGYSWKMVYVETMS
jgi:hypothetical protein